MESQITKETPLIRILAQIAAVWLAVDVGYYVLLPALGLSLSYNGNPFGISLYYALWLAIIIVMFQDVYRGWEPCKKAFQAYAFLIPLFAAILVFSAYVVPNLPPIVWTEVWDPPSELIFATPWYFLPKSIEILLQQLLIAVLVFSFSAHNFSLRSIAIWSATLFGGAHLLLALSGSPWGYVIRFSVSAVVFGLMYPYLMLRVPNGFLYSYGLHWLYYAVTVVMIHTISPYA